MRILLLVAAALLLTDVGCARPRRAPVVEVVRVERDVALLERPWQLRPGRWPFCVRTTPGRLCALVDGDRVPTCAEVPTAGEACLELRCPPLLPFGVDVRITDPAGQVATDRRDGYACTLGTAL